MFNDDYFFKVSFKLLLEDLFVLNESIVKEDDFIKIFFSKLESYRKNPTINKYDFVPLFG